MSIRSLIVATPLLWMAATLHSQPTAVISLGASSEGTRHINSYPNCMTATPDGGYLIGYGINDRESYRSPVYQFGIVKISHDRRIEWSQAYDFGTEIRNLEPMRIFHRSDGNYTVMIERDRSGIVLDEKPWDVVMLTIDPHGSVVASQHYPSLSKPRDSAAVAIDPFIRDQLVDIASFSDGFILLRETNTGFSLVWLDQQGEYRNGISYDLMSGEKSSSRLNQKLLPFAPRALTVDTKGYGIIVTGETIREPTVPHNSAIIQLDLAGQILHAKQLNDPNESEVFDVIAIKDGSTVLVGSTRDKPLDYSRLSAYSLAHGQSWAESEHMMMRYDSTLSDAAYWSVDASFTKCRSLRFVQRKWHTRIRSAVRLLSGEIVLVEQSQDGKLADMSERTQSDGLIRLTDDGTFLSYSTPGRLRQNDDDAGRRISFVNAVPGSDNTLLTNGSASGLRGHFYFIFHPDMLSTCMVEENVSVDTVGVDVGLTDLSVVADPYSRTPERSELNVRQIDFTSPFAFFCESSWSIDQLDNVQRESNTRGKAEGALSSTEMIHVSLANPVIRSGNDIELDIRYTQAGITDPIDLSLTVVSASSGATIVTRNIELVPGVRTSLRIPTTGWLSGPYLVAFEIDGSERNVKVIVTE